MKTIYVPIDGKVYRVNQDTHIPSILCDKQPGFSATLIKDPDNSTIVQAIDINTVLSNDKAAKTNRELYLDMLNLLREQHITEIPVINNNYKVYVDYSLFVEGKETEHSVVMKELQPLDMVAPLGCGTNSELLYRRVTDVKTRVSFKVRNTLPYGVMNQRKQNYRIQVNDISIFQDFGPFVPHHPSTFEVPYPVGSKNINNTLANCVLMYSTDAEGLLIQPVALNFAPRFVNIDINVILGHMVVAFDNLEVDRIVKENIHHKYHPDDPMPPIPPYPGPGPIIPPPDPHRPAEGDDDPGPDGRSDWYERATATNPGALRVVEDLFDPREYDAATMIHRWKVVRDIPDIEIGEYVLYREGFDAALS